MTLPIEKQLELYTLQNPQEVLLVVIEVYGECDEIIVFKGFSSSLVRQTASDPDIPLFPSDAVINSVSRLASPYQPDCPNYLERQISWAEFSQRLSGLHI